MAEQKKLGTRISLKYDTLANWLSNDPVLNKGEVAFAVIETADPAQKHLPPIMQKVGDGTSKFSALGWSAALAADVYAWAKAASRPTYKYGDDDLTGFGTAAEKNVGDFDAAGAASTAEQNAKDYVDEKIAAIPAQAEFTLETGDTDGSLVLKKNNVVVGSVAVVKGWADLIAKAQKGVDDADAAQTAAAKAQSTIDEYKTSNDVALAAVKETAEAAQTSAQVDTKISAHNSSTEAHSDIRQSITALAEKVSGRATGYVFKNKKDAAYVEAVGKAGSFVVGDTIYFTDTKIADQWVTAVNAEAPFYTFQDIETEAPSFDGYVTGTGLTADKIVLGNGGSSVKAGAVGIAATLTADDDVNLPTNGAVSKYVSSEIGKLSLAEVAVAAGETIKTISEANGKVSVEKQSIAIEQSQVNGLTTALGGKQDSLSETQLAAVNSGITAAKVAQYDGYAAGKQDVINAQNKLSAEFISGLGAAASKDVAETVTASGTDLTTAKAVTDYVAAQGFTKNVGTVTSVAAGTGLKITGDASVNPTVEIDDTVEFIFDCGTSVV